MGPNESRNLVISIGAGIFASFMIYSYSQEKKAEYDKQYGDTKRIVIAKEDIAEMQTVYDNMLETVERPSKFIEPDAIQATEEIVGNVAAVPIKKGQQFVRSRLLTPGPDTGISLQVAPSKRAITIPIDEVRGIAKLIRPGDRLDIYAAVDTGKGINQRREVQVLMQDVVVLATGLSVVNNIPRIFEVDSSGKNAQQIALTGDSKYTTITVESSPKEAQDLIYILSTSPGNLYFTLRNPNDRVALTRQPASTAESVLGRPTANLDSPVIAAPPPVAPIAPPSNVRPPPQNQNRSRGGFKRL